MGVVAIYNIIYNPTILKFLDPPLQGDGFLLLEIIQSKRYNTLHLEASIEWSRGPLVAGDINFKVPLNCVGVRWGI